SRRRRRAVRGCGWRSPDRRASDVTVHVGFPPVTRRRTPMGAGAVWRDPRGMLSGLTHRAPSLLAIAVTGAIAWAGQGSASPATCAPGATDKPDLGFVDSNCDGIDGDKANAIFVAPNGND